MTPTTAQTTSSSSGWLMYSVWGYRPVTPPGQDILDSMLDEAVDGSNDYRFNPVKTAKNEYRKTLVDYLNANLALTWKITPDLTFKTTGGYVLNKRRREEFNGSETYTGYAGSPSGKGVNGAIYWTDQTSWSNENTLNYKKRLGRSHNLDLMAGLSLQGQKNTYDGVASTQITSEELGIAGIHTGNYQKVQSNYYDWRMMSAFLRANYNFRYKYYLTFSFRADGSSKFPSDNRWGYFPSAGLSWNFNRENLLKKSERMSNGKLRLSWGLTGNNRTQTPYDFYSQITVNPGSGNSLDYVFGGERVPGYYVSNMANERLKWETTEQWNAGLDLGFFEDRIKVTADWYDKVTRDLLLYALLPASSGFEQGMLNIGKIRNRGFELTLETVNVKTRQFQWSTSFNIAFNRNRILGLVDGQNTLQSSVSWETRFNSQFPYISQVGKPTGMMYGFIYDGTYKAEDFDDKGNLVSGVPSFKGNAMQPGDMKYRDMNGDGVIDDYDRTIIGCGQPLNTGGFGNLVIVRHPNGLETWHAHLSKLNVQVNEYVKTGQVIGFSGNTGRSRGPHLHFEMRYCDQTFDPEFIIDFPTGCLKYHTFALEKSFFNIHSRARSCSWAGSSVSNKQWRNERPRKALHFQVPYPSFGFTVPKPVRTNHRRTEPADCRLCSSKDKSSIQFGQILSPVTARENHTLNPFFSDQTVKILLHRTVGQNDQILIAPPCTGREKERISTDV